MKEKRAAVQKGRAIELLKVNGKTFRFEIIDIKENNEINPGDSVSVEDTPFPGIARFLTIEV